MRTTLLAAALFVLGASSSSQANTPLDVCVEYADTAATVMTNRQAGVPEQAMIDDIVTTEPNVAAAMEALVREAYREPRYQMPTFKRDATEFFKQQAFITCIYVLGGNNQ